MNPLGFATAGDEQRLTFVDDVGITDGWVRLCDARPIGGMAELGVSDRRQCVALLNDDSCGRAETRGYCRQENLGACHDVVGVNDGRIDSQQIMPAKTLTEAFLGKLPE